MQENTADGFRKFYQPFRSFKDFKYLYFWSFFNSYQCAYAQTFTANQGLPGQSIAAAQEEYFHAPARLFAGVHPCRDHTCLIQHEQIPRAQVVSHITKDAMFQFTSVTMKHKQTR
jgi:hypothetical protein